MGIELFRNDKIICVIMEISLLRDSPIANQVAVVIVDPEMFPTTIQIAQHYTNQA